MRHAYLLASARRRRPLASVCAIGFASSALSQSLGPLVRVTGPDPFASCTKDNVGQQEKAFGSVLYPNTAIEPWIAADPTDAARFLVGHQQDRWSDGGARGNVGVVSGDGGGSWTDTIPSGVTECAGGKYDRASDPWTAFANDGTALFESLAVDPAKPQTPFGARQQRDIAEPIDRSRRNLGRAGHAPQQQLAARAQRQGLPDRRPDRERPRLCGMGSTERLPTERPGRPAHSAGRRHPDGAGVAQFCGWQFGSVRALRAAVQGRRSLRRPPYGFNYTGPSMLAISPNNGASWGAPAAIYSPGTNAQTIDNLVQVTPKGYVYDFFTAINVTPGLNIGFVCSSNKGISWSGLILATDIQVAGVVSPDSGQPLRDAAMLYSVAVNPLSGAIYLAWQDFRFSTANCITPMTPSPGIPVDGIVFTQSLDGGTTWSAPIMINQTPPNPPTHAVQQAFVPAIVATGDGKAVVVTYYDFRNDTNTPAGFEGTDYFAIICTTASDCSKAAVGATNSA